MITLVGMWEHGWLDPKVELFMFRQLCNAFEVDRLVMVPKMLAPRTSVDQYDTMDEALASCEGVLVFLEPSGDVNLDTFTHPEKAVYVFGKAMIGNHQREGLKVRINTPAMTDLFAVNAAAIILADRL